MPLQTKALTKCTTGALLALLFGGCGPTPDTTSGPPTLPANFAVRPMFKLRDGRDIQAGTAFSATMDGSAPVLISAMHLFGEAGGLINDLPGSTLPEAIASVGLYDMEYGKPLASAGIELIRDGKATDFSTGDCSPDVVAFAMDSHSGLGVLPLAKSNPTVGARVWAVGREYKDEGADAKLYAGNVSDVKDTAITIDEETPYDGKGFSGGPVVNAQGEVIGTTIGSGSSGGRTHAFLNPVESIRKHLLTAGVH